MFSIDNTHFRLLWGLFLGVSKISGLTSTSQKALAWMGVLAIFVKHTIKDQFP